MDSGAGLCLTVASFWNAQDQSAAPSYDIYGPQVQPPRPCAAPVWVQRVSWRGSAGGVLAAQGLRKVLDGMGSYADTRVLKHRATEVLPGAADSTFTTDSVSITPVILTLSQARLLRCSVLPMALGPGHARALCGRP